MEGNGETEAAERQSGRRTDGRERAETTPEWR